MRWNLIIDFMCIIIILLPFYHNFLNVKLIEKNNNNNIMYNMNDYSTNSHISSNIIVKLYGLRMNLIRI